MKDVMNNSNNLLLKITTPITHITPPITHISLIMYKKTTPITYITSITYKKQL